MPKKSSVIGVAGDFVKKNPPRKCGGFKSE